MIKKLKSYKTNAICIGILVLIYLAIVLIITRFKFAYGSTTDWNNQHYVFAEYFRNLFYETKNFFPSFAPQIGAGQNIYNFSYYGLFNPLILPSYLLPFVSMSAYIQIVSIICTLVSVIMFYFWIKKRYEIKIAFFVSCLFLLASPIIFHSHRHIMFVWYFPFLIGALFCCDRFFEKKNRAGLIFCLTMIMLTSYYFSVGSYLAVFVYITAVYLSENSAFRIKEYIKTVVNLGICMLVSVMISAVLWLPTLNAIMQGRAETNTNVSLKDILLPTLDYDVVLYDFYSLGLTLISLMAIVFAVLRKNKGYRFIGIVLSAFVVFKILPFVMNGFMYSENKAIIPLIPIALLLTAEFVKAVFDRNISMRFWLLMNLGIVLGGVIYLLINEENSILLPLIIDIVFLNAAFLIYYKKWNSTAFISIISIAVFALCLTFNSYDTLSLKKDVVKVDKEYSKEIDSTNFSKNDKSIYRVSLFADEGETINKVYGENYYQTTVYSSLQSQLYNHFYYDEFQNEMPHRISAMISETMNPFFCSFMGNRYLFVDNKTLLKKRVSVPNGYKEVKREKNITLFVNENVMPLGYASSNLISCEQYDKLAYPYNMKALMDYIAVDKKLSDVPIDGVEDKGVDLANELFAELPENIRYDKQENAVYVNTYEKNNRHFKTSGTKNAYDSDKCVVNLKNPINDYLIITCNADNKISKKPTDIYMTINGIKNKLTEPEWKYYNNNNSFCFVLSSNEPIESITLNFSRGEYKLSDWRFYTVKKSELEDLKNNIDEFIINKSKTKGDVFQGTINVKNDNSYFKLSIPYDKGFSAYVDGKKTDIETVDKAFIGFEISKGKHNIKIVYKAPLLKEAKIISLLGVLMFAFILSVQILKRRFYLRLSKKYNKRQSN